MYWTDCNGIWFTAIDAFQDRAYKLLSEACNRYEGYIYCDNQSLEDCQETIKLEFEGQDRCNSYDEYFDYLLENAPEKVPSEYFQIKDSIQHHCRILNSLHNLINNEDLVGLNKIK